MAALSAHAERILASVSGLPRSTREQRRFMVLQAYIDDSCEAGQVLVFAGYVASVEQWLRFSDEWAAALELARWPSFKMADIAGSGNQDRLERAGYFYRIIEDHAEAIVAVAVEMEGLSRAVKELGLPDQFANPYAMIYRIVLDFTAQFQTKIGLNEPIDFIFDNHSQESKVDTGFKLMRNRITDDNRRKLLGRPPRFEDDREYLPLQAADLLAWHVRRQWLKFGTIVGMPFEMSWPHRKNIEGFRANFTYADAKDNLTRMIAEEGSRRRGQMSLDITFTDLAGRTF